MNFAVYGLVAILLLGGANWWQFSHGRTLEKRAETAEEAVRQARADAEASAKAAQASAVAQEQLAAKVNVLRSNYEKRARELARLPNDGCLDRDLPADADRGLRDTPDAGAGTPAPANARPAPAADVGWSDLSGLADLLLASPGSGSGQRGGQGSCPRRPDCT